MCKEPFFSIILPVYNVKNYLNRCVDKLLREKFRNFEIILVDDGSTDGCYNICNEYMKKDSRISVIHKENGGLSSARNEGFKIAKGKYIFWLDSDDYIVQDALNILYNYLKDENIDIIKYNFIKQPVNVPEYSILKAGIYNKEEICNSVLKLAIENTGRFIWSVWSHVYRRKFLEQNNLSFVSEREIGSEDYLFNLQTYLRAKKILVIKEALYNYDLRIGSLTNRYRWNLMDQYLKLYNLMCNEVVQSDNNQLMESLYNFYVWNGYHVLMTNEMRITEKHKTKDRNQNIRKLLKQESFANALKEIKTNELSMSQVIIYSFMKLRLWYMLIVLMKIRKR